MREKLKRQKPAAAGKLQAEKKSQARAGVLREGVGGAGDKETRGRGDKERGCG